MSRSTNKKYDKLRKKHIWPSVVLLVVVMAISFVCLLVALGYYVANITDNKMSVAHEEANDIKYAIDKELSNGATYEEALATIAKRDDSFSACIVDSNNQLLALVGEETIDLSGREAGLSEELGFESEEDDVYEFFWDLEDDEQAFGFVLSGNHPMSILHQIMRGDSLDEGSSSWYRATVIQFPYWITSTPLADGNVVAVKQMLRVQRQELLLILLLGICFLVVVFIVLLVLLGNVISNVHYQRRLTKLVSTDAVTGGNNWFYFSEHARRVLSKRKNAKKGYAIIDFEWLKYRTFCTLHGMETGEAALEQLSRYLESKLRKQEMCAHYAKGNFAILLCCGNQGTDASAVENRVEAWMQEIPAVLGYSNIVLHAGIYDVDATFVEGEAIRRSDVDINKAYNNAGIARASIASDNNSEAAHFNYQMWEDQMWEHKVLSMMHKALENEEFLVYIQPKYNPSTKELAGAEALIRWQSPTEGFLPPGKFIPIFEKSDFITKIDDYMISHVAKLQSEWLQAGKKIVPISVNVSRIHFAQPDLAEHIASLVDVYGVPHEYIEIELTESAFFDDKAALLGTIGKLKELGFDVSMDDFGSGYSSLNSLKDLPLDVLKLDAEFFRGEREDDRGEIVISEAINLGKQLNMRIVAEGVEEKDQVEFLAKLGCDMIQGYYFAKPMPANEYEERMS